MYRHAVRERVYHRKAAWICVFALAYLKSFSALCPDRCMCVGVWACVCVCVEAGVRCTRATNEIV